MNQTPSIFQQYYSDEPFVDRFISQPSEAVDVIIPVIHTNELWHSNLRSIYREIPVSRLLIGDGGCIDNSLDIVRQFPRVTIFDHRQFTSLGYSIRKLIEAVETDWFVYLHSDVYLPPGWFDITCQHQNQLDWIETRHQHTIMVELPRDYSNDPRSFSGAQMGRRVAFDDIVPTIDDDYLYRNEDIILANLVTRAGYRYQRVDDVFHYHQVVRKQSPWVRDIQRVNIQVIPERIEEIRTCMMQAKGIIKYLEPTPYLSYLVATNISRLRELGEVSWLEVQQWPAQLNPAWQSYIRSWQKECLRIWLTKKIQQLLRDVRDRLFG